MDKIAIVILCFLVLVASTKVTIPDAEFNVLQYGAKGDGKTDDTKAIQSAFTACAQAGGGSVYFPSGHTFLTFPFSFTSSKTSILVDQGATIKASDNIANWPVSGGKYQDFVSAVGYNNIQITGAGTIDGSGATWWSEFKKGTLKYDRPDLVYFSKVSHALLSDTTYINSPNHNLELFSDDTEISKVTVTAPSDSPNTDALDIHGSPFWVHDCHFSVGDDNIAQHSNDTVVENCNFGSGHGASIGSVNVGYIRNVTFRNINFDGTTQAIRIKTDPGAVGYVKDVVYENLKLSNVKTQIVITMFYASNTTKATSLKISNITIQHVTATNGQNSGQILCQPSSPCRDIHLIDINFGSSITPFQCSNAFGTAAQVSPSSCLKT